MHINGNTALMGLIGNPVAHSYSPYLHNRILQDLGIDAVYVPLYVPNDQLPQAVGAIRALSFRGVNVTIPYKESVIPYLDEVKGDAEHCQAVNVIVNREGRLTGYNTDGQGFIAALRENRVSLGGKAILIGAGGAARSVSYSLARSGFEEIVLLDTYLDRASSLAELINRKTSCLTTGLIMNSQSFSLNAHDAALIVNCSPVGMHPLIEQSPVENFADLPSDAVLCDLIYNPLQTRFLQMGRQRGLKTINGLPMFIHQAALTLEMILGIEPPIGLMKEAMANAVG